MALKNLISVKKAGTILLIALSALLLFHILVVFNLIPSDMIWGGQINDSNFYIFELIAFVILILFIAIIMGKLEYFKFQKLRWVINPGVWIMTIYFILNAIGNFVSGVSSENFIFGPISIILALLAFRLAIDKQ